MSGSKTFAFRKHFWSLFAEKLFDCVKMFVCGNFLDQEENHCEKNRCLLKNFCGKFSWLWKNSLTVETFLDCGKIPQLSKKFPDSGKILWKNSLNLEKFLDGGKIYRQRRKISWCGKLSFLAAEKIKRLIIFKPLRHIFWF